MNHCIKPATFHMVVACVQHEHIRNGHNLTTNVKVSITVLQIMMYVAHLSWLFTPLLMLHQCNSTISDSLQYRQIIGARKRTITTY